jgi:hypothetical protein
MRPERIVPESSGRRLGKIPRCSTAGQSRPAGLNHALREDDDLPKAERTARTRAASDEHFVDRHPVVPGDDVGDAVGDVIQAQWFDGGDLLAGGCPQVCGDVVDEFGVDGARLDDADSYPVGE